MSVAEHEEAEPRLCQECFEEICAGRLCLRCRMYYRDEYADAKIQEEKEGH